MVKLESRGGGDAAQQAVAADGRLRRPPLNGKAFDGPIGRRQPLARISRSISAASLNEIPVRVPEMRTRPSLDPRVGQMRARHNVSLRMTCDSLLTLPAFVGARDFVSERMQRVLASTNVPIPMYRMFARKGDLSTMLSWLSAITSASDYERQKGSPYYCSRNQVHLSDRHHCCENVPKIFFRVRRRGRRTRR